MPCGRPEVGRQMDNDSTLTRGISVSPPLAPPPPQPLGIAPHPSPEPSPIVGLVGGYCPKEILTRQYNEFSKFYWSLYFVVSGMVIKIGIPFNEIGNDIN